MGIHAYCCLLSLLADVHAAGDAEGGGDGGEHGDDDVQDFTPELFVFHVFS